MRVVHCLNVVLLLAAIAAAAHAQNADEQRLLALLNQERQKAGLPTLQWDSHLAQSAHAHGQMVAKHRQLSHQFPGEPELGERLAATGLRFNVAGENVAVAPTAEQAHEGLMGSPPHRANILSAQYNVVGLAAIAHGDQVYVVQNFAHALPNYSVSQFRDGVVAAFNEARRAKGLPAIKVVPDQRLEQVACSGETDPEKVLAQTKGAVDLQIFTSSVPAKLPGHMQAAAADPKLNRLNIGVCFKPGKDHGYASFVVVAAFFPAE